MSRRAAAVSVQMELLAWTPPVARAQFDEVRGRAQSVPARLARAIGAALADAAALGITREDVARRMGEFLGERVSVNMLNGYASQARADHVIGVPRFLALLHATGDRRLLELLAEPMGWRWWKAAWSG